MTLKQQNSIIEKRIKINYDKYMLKTPKEWQVYNANRGQRLLSWKLYECDKHKKISEEEYTNTYVHPNDR